MSQTSGVIRNQLRRHVPFTALGTATGIALMLILIATGTSRQTSQTLFWIAHPLHVLFGAITTAAVYHLHASGGWMRIVLVGYLGSIGIATLSDSLLPFLGEWLLGLPNRGIHLGFITRWWLVNPLAAAGSVIAIFWTHTRFPHAGHVFLGTWASLFHMTMATGRETAWWTWAAIPFFLFLAVWIPTLLSDIVFPLLVAGGRARKH